EGRLIGFFDPRTAAAEEIAAAAMPASGGREPPDGHKPSGGSRPPLAGRPPLARRPPLAGRPMLPRELALLRIVLLLFGLLQWRTGEFLRPENLRNVLTDAALLGFCAVGATVVILAGGLDISLGALMALSAGIAGRLWEQGYPLPVVAAVALAVGA